MYLPVVARHESANALFALHQQRERGRLYPADGRQVEATLLGVERRHRPRTVDADQPVGLRPALGRVGERQQRRVRAQAGEAVADCLLGHRLQPQPRDGLVGASVLHDVAENQLPFAPGIAGVDQSTDVLALDQAQQQIEALRVALDGGQCEMRRNNRQVRERPFSALHLELLWHYELEQVANRRREHIVIAFEIVALARETAQRARDVGGDGGLFCNDQTFRHLVLPGLQR